MSILTIQVICAGLLFLFLIFCFVSIDTWKIKRKLKKTIKKWDDEVKESDKKNYNRKNK